MSVLPIAVAGAPILRETAQEVKKFDRKLGKLLDNMRDTMYKAHGVGLAAPQVSVSQRIVVIDIGNSDGLFEFVNPVLSDPEGSVVNLEGCLSVPDYDGEVERAEKITVTYQDRKGKPHALRAEGLFAIALQHETDHLNGVLFVDKAITLEPKEKEKP